MQAYVYLDKIQPDVYIGVNKNNNHERIIIA